MTSAKRKNLAAAKPELATDLNTLITRYLAGTEAVVPILNPDCNKLPAKPTSGKDNYLLLRWKSRQRGTTIKDGILVTATGQDTFLAFAAGKLANSASTSKATAAAAKWHGSPHPTPETHRILPGSP
jgi:hypothetical protein